MPRRLIAALGLWSGRAALASGFAPPDARGHASHMGTTALVILLAALAIAVAVTMGLRVKREREADALAIRLTQGDPTRGPVLARIYGCAGCHNMPGVRGPGGKVGPPLDDVGARVYLGGRLTNTPDNLIRWIENPRAVDPQTAMPATGISQRDARDMAAYLLTRR
jgi:cytochrome c2